MLNEQSLGWKSNFKIVKVGDQIVSGLEGARNKVMNLDRFDLA